MSKPSARQPMVDSLGYETSVKRCVLAVVLVVLGIAWMAVYYTVARDAALYDARLGGAKPSDPLPFMSALSRWNYLIGFGLVIVGLMVAAHKLTPLGRGRGVVIGMLFCFIFGLLWILVFYFVGDSLASIPVMNDLNQFNLLVGVAFMAAGFTFATKWE